MKLNQGDKQTKRLDIRGVIFDMDGLLLDTEALYLKAWPPVGEMMGIPITEAVARQTVGHDAKATAAVFQTHYGTAFTLEQAKPLIRQWILDHVEKHGLTVKPGARALLEFFKARGLPLAIGSSNIEQNVRAFLEEADLLSYFDVIVTADLVEHPKPAPDIFLKAAEELGFSPAQCLVLEDSPTGVQAAHAAGCVTIVVPDLIQPCEMTRSRVLRVLGSLEEARSLFVRGTTQ